MIKSLGSANKIIATHAYQAVLSLYLENLVSFHTIEYLLEKFSHHKISKVRERIAEFTCIFIEAVGSGEKNEKLSKD